MRLIDIFFIFVFITYLIPLTMNLAIIETRIHSIRNQK